MICIDGSTGHVVMLYSSHVQLYSCEEDGGKVRLVQTGRLEDYQMSGFLLLFTGLETV